MDWRRLLLDADAGSWRSLDTLCRSLEREGEKGPVYAALKKALKILPREPLDQTHPELCKQWSHKNKEKPAMFMATSPDMVWWTCPDIYGHEWEMVIETRVEDDHGCLECFKGWYQHRRGMHIPGMTFLWNGSWGSKKYLDRWKEFALRIDRSTQRNR